MESEKNDIYFLLKDIISCYPTKVAFNLSRTLNQHLIAKEVIRQIFRDEIQLKKTNYKIIAGSLIIQNSFLRESPRSAVYELIEILPEVKRCLKNDYRLTIQRLSKELIFRLFLALHKEFVMLQKKADINYLKEFKSEFSEDFISSIIFDEKSGLSVRFIFQDYGFNFDGKPIDKKNKIIKSILSRFYS